MTTTNATLLHALRTVLTCDLSDLPGDVVAVMQQAVESAENDPPIGGAIENAQLYLRSFDGRLIRVDALFPVADPNGFAKEPANDYMREHDGASLLAICNRVALIAAKDDHGITEAALAKQPLPEAPPAPDAAPAVALNVQLTPQFVGDVLCTMIESSYPWFDWRDEIRENDPEDVIGWRYSSARAVEIDEEDQTEEGEGQSRIIDGAAIAEAMGKILQGGICNKTMMGYISNAVADQDGGHIDMDVADCIAQVAVFGQLRYG